MLDTSPFTQAIAAMIVGGGRTMSLLNWSACVSAGESRQNLDTHPSDQELRLALQRASDVQATLEQIERQLSHRYESEELSATRASLKLIRDYIRLAKLECRGA